MTDGLCKDLLEVTNHHRPSKDDWHFSDTNDISALSACRPMHANFTPFCKNLVKIPVVHLADDKSISIGKKKLVNIRWLWTTWEHWHGLLLPAWQYWPLIGQSSSRDLDSGLWLVQSDPLTSAHHRTRSLTLWLTHCVSPIKNCIIL